MSISPLWSKDLSTDDGSWGSPGTRQVYEVVGVSVVTGRWSWGHVRRGRYNVVSGVSRVRRTETSSTPKRSLGSGVPCGRPRQRGRGPPVGGRGPGHRRGLCVSCSFPEMTLGRVNVLFYIIRFSGKTWFFPFLLLIWGSLGGEITSLHCTSRHRDPRSPGRSR